MGYEIEVKINYLNENDLESQRKLVSPSTQFVKQSGITQLLKKLNASHLSHELSEPSSGFDLQAELSSHR